MAQLISKVVYGYDKEEAMKDLNLEIAHNATAKWRNMGEPTFGSPKFEQFCQDFIKAKKITTGGGAYIVKSSAQKDTRKRPYTIESFKKSGRTKWQTVYILCELNEDGTPGAVIDKGFDKKYGARSLRRAIQKEIEDYVSTEILFGNIEEGDIINVDANDGSLIFSYTKSVKTEDKELSKS